MQENGCQKENFDKIQSWIIQQFPGFAYIYLARNDKKPIFYENKHISAKPAITLNIVDFPRPKGPKVT